jgi:hypothetical protein
MNGEWVIAAPEFGDVRERGIQFDYGTPVALIVWDRDCHEGEVALHPEFDALGGSIEALDILQDAIGLLQREYDRRMAMRRVG